MHSISYKADNQNDIYSRRNGNTVEEKKIEEKEED